MAEVVPVVGVIKEGIEEDIAGDIVEDACFNKDCCAPFVCVSADKWRLVVEFDVNGAGSKAEVRTEAFADIKIVFDAKIEGPIANGRFIVQASRTAALMVVGNI